MKLFFVKSMQKITKSFTKVVLANPRGIPRAILEKSLKRCTLERRSSHIAMNIGGNMNFITSGKHNAARKFMSASAALTRSCGFALIEENSTSLFVCIVSILKYFFCYSLFCELKSIVIRGCLSKKPNGLCCFLSTKSGLDFIHLFRGHSIYLVAVHFVHLVP